jgi:hypothetical protein
MGSILINVPKIPASDLVFNETETRDILKFFWPMYSARIDAMDIDIGTRRMAQSLLMAAIDASYALGFVDLLFTSVAKPGKSLASMGKKLAKKYAKHMWQHATEKDLMEAKIYETIRKAVAYQCRYLLDSRLNGLARMPGRIAPFYVIGDVSPIWG